MVEKLKGLKRKMDFKSNLSIVDINNYMHKYGYRMTWTEYNMTDCIDIGSQFAKDNDITPRELNEYEIIWELTYSKYRNNDIILITGVLYSDNESHQIMRIKEEMPYWNRNR